VFEILAQLAAQSDSEAVKTVEFVAILAGQQPKDMSKL